MRGGV